MSISTRRHYRLTLPAIIAGFRPADADLKTSFRAATKSVLEDLVLALGLPDGTYDLRWNAGGVAVSGDWTVHTDAFHLIVSVGDVRPVRYRTCTSRHDHTGGLNRWATAEQLCDVVTFAATLRAMVGSPPHEARIAAGVTAGAPRSACSPIGTTAQ